MDSNLLPPSELPDHHGAMPFPCPYNPSDYHFNDLEVEVEQPPVMTSATFEASNSIFFSTTTEPFVSSSQEMAPGAGITASFDGIGMPFPCPDNPADYYFNYHLGVQVLHHHLELEEVEQPLVTTNCTSEASNSSFVFSTTTEPFVSASSQEMVPDAGCTTGSFDGILRMPFTNGHHLQQELKMKDDEQIMSGKVERHIVVIRTETRLETLYDGFNWRKYGKKIIKGSPHPRHYYRCSIGGCQVKKIVERDVEDSSFLRSTYVGKHNHASST